MGQGRKGRVGPLHVIARQGRRRKVPAPKGNQYAKGSKTNGRPPSYRPAYAAQAKKLCERGATNGDLARFFKVAISTIQWWRARYEDFSVAVRLGKQVADERAEQALFERAVGYDYDDGTSRGKPVLRHMPPDVGALKVWLFNRRPDRWKEKVEITDRRGGWADKSPLEIKREMVRRMVQWGLVPIKNVPPDLLPLPDGTIDEDD
jgi:hypothetical protein